MTRIVIPANLTPYKVGIFFDGTYLVPYGGCCGDRLLRDGTLSDHVEERYIVCPCGKTKIPPSTFTLECNLEVVTPGVWPSWVSDFTGIPKYKLKVELNR